MKAYVLSRECGTVQIGNVVFQPCTGAKFHADRKGLRKAIAVIEVKEASMEEARRALEESASNELNELNNTCKLAKVSWKDEGNVINIFSDDVVLCEFWGEDKFQKATAYVKKMYDDCKNAIRGGIE